MPSVDNRIVEMRFDNKQFESGVGTSLTSLEKLKKSLTDEYPLIVKGIKDVIIPFTFLFVDVIMILIGGVCMQIEIERLEFIGDSQDGHFKRTKEIREYENPDNREVELCVICGFPDYPECLKWCKNGQFAMKQEGVESRD